jgi:hypothetical protein
MRRKAAAQVAFWKVGLLRLQMESERRRLKQEVSKPHALNA